MTEPEDVRTALQSLVHETPPTNGWCGPDVVRHLAVRRRRARRGLFAGAALVVAAAIALPLALTGGSGPAPVRVAAVPGVRVGARIDGAVQLVSDDQHTGAARAASTAVVQAGQSLAIRLLQQLGSAEHNTSVSPYSLQLALAMLQSGARGSTARQIATALQTSSLSSGAQDAQLAALTRELTAAARGQLSLDSANSLWQQQGYRLRRAFLADIGRYFGAGVWQTNFRTSAGLDAINHWTDTSTRHTIPTLFDSLDPSTVLVLANALYLHADWQSPFVKGETSPGTFTTANGRHVRAQFMSGGGATQLAQTAGYDAAQLPYRGGRFAALVVMPTHESLADYVAGLTPSALNSVTGALRAPRGGIELPRFTTRTTTDLVPVLKRLGMRQAFTPAADLSGIGGGGLSVDQVIQRVYLNVDEKGTTAAAATGIAVAVSGAAFTPVRFDHPFLFLIRDTRTGAVLFASEVNDPAAG